MPYRQWLSPPQRVASSSSSCAAIFDFVKAFASARACVIVSVDLACAREMHQCTRLACVGGLDVTWPENDAKRSDRIAWRTVGQVNRWYSESGLFVVIYWSVCAHSAVCRVQNMAELATLLFECTLTGNIICGLLTLKHSQRQILSRCEHWQLIWTRDCDVVA